MVKKFHELKIGDVFISVHPSSCSFRFCKIAEPVPGVNKSEQLPNAIVIDDIPKVPKWRSMQPAKDYFNSKVGNYMVLSYDEPVDLIKSIYDDKYAEDIYDTQVKRHNKRIADMLRSYIKEVDYESSVLKNFIDLLSNEDF